MYALLAERADETDRHLWAAALQAERPSEVFADLSERTQLDDWLAEPVGDTAEAERALVAYLKGA